MLRAAVSRGRGGSFQRVAPEHTALLNVSENRQTQQRLALWRWLTDERAADQSEPPRTSASQRPCTRTSCTRAFEATLRAAAGSLRFPARPSCQSPRGAISIAAWIPLPLINIRLPLSCDKHRKKGEEDEGLAASRTAGADWRGLPMTHFSSVISGCMLPCIF